MQHLSNLCILPWISIEATSLGAVRPCCLADTELTHNGQKLTASDGLKQAYYSDSMNMLRQEFLAGEKPAMCRRCWAEEDAGMTSKRQWNLIKFNKKLNLINWNAPSIDQLWFLDLKLGTICNLKCRICGTWSSSKWAQEDIERQSRGDKKTTPAYKQLKLGEWPRRAPAFWSELETLLPNVEYFEFTGGEPFLIQEHIDLLQRAVDLGYSKNISIHYNSNGTVWTAKLEELWQHFKKVEIAFSIDNIGKRFELERSGANWDEVCQNIESAKQFRKRSNNIHLQVCTTVNIQNVFYLRDICSWLEAQKFDSVHFNILHDPEFMCIATMPAAAKAVVIDQLQFAKDNMFRADIEAIIKFIQNGKESSGEKFRAFMRQVDSARGENFADTHPEIAKAMEYGKT